MALQKRFNDLREHFVDPYWTIISGVLSHGRGRPKLTLDQTRKALEWPSPCFLSSRLLATSRAIVEFVEVFEFGKRSPVRFIHAYRPWRTSSAGVGGWLKGRQ